MSLCLLKLSLLKISDTKTDLIFFVLICTLGEVLPIFDIVEPSLVQWNAGIKKRRGYSILQELGTRIEKQHRACCYPIPLGPASKTSRYG